MSYDYNAIVTKINLLRTSAYSSNDKKCIDVNLLSEAVELYSLLSSHCPLPPALWIQYANDTGKVMELLLSDDDSGSTASENVVCNNIEICDVKLGILELGINEFPGCSKLYLCQIEELMTKHRHQIKQSTQCSMSNNPPNITDTDCDISGQIEKSFQTAWKNIGLGSHRSDENVIKMWDLFCQHVLKSKEKCGIDSFNKSSLTPLLSNAYIEKMVDLFKMRSRVPHDTNDELLDTLSSATDLSDAKVEHNNGKTKLSEVIENNCRLVSKVYNAFVSYETAILSCMSSEQLLHSSRQLLGYGGSETASSFVTYARALSKNPKVEHLSYLVYERGLSECPTVEDLWVAYIYDVIKKENFLDQQSISIGLCDRAVNNCPYSVRLFTLKMRCVSNAYIDDGTDNIDTLLSEKLVNVAKEATAAKFFPDAQSYLNLWLEVCRILRRNLMYQMSLKQGPIMYDESDDTSKKKSKVHRNDAQEFNDDDVQCSIDEIRDAFDSIDEFVIKNYSSWVDGRLQVWKERAWTESKVISPTQRYQMAGQNQGDGYGNEADREAVNCFEKIVKLQPSKYSSWKEYIAYTIHICHKNKRNNSALFSALRKARALYMRALHVVSPCVHFIAEKVSNPTDTDGFVSLTEDFVQFENCFGSSESLALGQGRIKAKLRRFHTGAKNSSTFTSFEATAIDSNDSTQSSKSAENNSLKRKHEENVETTINHEKKLKCDDGVSSHTDVGTLSIKIPLSTASASGENKKVNLKVERNKNSAIKVRVGKLDYPAHRYTVRVSNLSPDTTDMDLVDTFNICCPIVFSRILREKGKFNRNYNNGIGKSKGIGLVQFEEASGTESALQLHEEVKLHDRLLKVERSHIPAVPSQVPSGMHRISPKGTGRISKHNKKMAAKKAADLGENMHSDERNVLHNSRNDGTTKVTGNETHESENVDHALVNKTGNANQDRMDSNTNTTSSNQSVLAFAPRGVKNRRKKIIITSAGQN